VLYWLRHRDSLIAYNFRIEWHGIHLDRLQVLPKANSDQKQVQEAPSSHSDTPVLPWTLLDVLHSSWQLAASEPRDHVYAFLGHHSASHTLTGDLIATPDYMANLARVYSDFAICWLEWTQDLNILSFVQHGHELSFVQHGHEGTMNIALPSWVPMWNAYDGSVIAQLGESIFNAGTESKTASQLIKEGKLLKVGAIIFDKSQYRSTVFDEKDFRWASGN
jgi:hypothetical protein